MTTSIPSLSDLATADAYSAECVHRNHVRHLDSERARARREFGASSPEAAEAYQAYAAARDTYEGE